MVDDEIRDDLVVAGHYALDSRDNVFVGYVGGDFVDMGFEVWRRHNHQQSVSLGAYVVYVA